MPCCKGSATFSLEAQRLYSLGKGAKHHWAKVCSEPSGASHPPVTDICGEQEAGTCFTASLFLTPLPCWREASSQNVTTPVPFPSIKKAFFFLSTTLSFPLWGVYALAHLHPNALSSHAALQLCLDDTPAVHPVAQDAGAAMGHRHCCTQWASRGWGSVVCHQPTVLPLKQEGDFFHLQRRGVGRGPSSLQIRVLSF